MFQEPEEIVSDKDVQIHCNLSRGFGFARMGEAEFGPHLVEVYPRGP